MKIFVILVAVIAVSTITIDAKCTKSIQCESVEGTPPYCRNGQCTRWGLIPDETGLDPCSTVRCTATTTCVIIQVQCFTFPCPGQARCSLNSWTS